MNNVLIIILYLASSLSANSWKCQQCLSQGKRQCVSDYDFQTGKCCSENDDEYTKKECEKLKICTTSKFKSTTIQQFACPSDAIKCPAGAATQLKISSEEDEYQRSWNWVQQVVPTIYAKDWNCKYKVTLSGWFKSKMDRQKVYGYMLIQFEQTGFDQFVDIIVQLRDEFQDLNQTDESNEVTKYQNPLTVPQVFRNKNGIKYLISAQNDVYISFAPVKNSPENHMYTTLKGGIEISARFQRNVTEEDENNENIKIMYDTRSDKYNKLVQEQQSTLKKSEEELKNMESDWKYKLKQYLVPENGEFKIVFGGVFAGICVCTILCCFLNCCQSRCCRRNMKAPVYKKKILEQRKEKQVTRDDIFELKMKVENKKAEIMTKQNQVVDDQQDQNSNNQNDEAARSMSQPQANSNLRSRNELAQNQTNATSDQLLRQSFQSNLNFQENQPGLSITHNNADIEIKGRQNDQIEDYEEVKIQSEREPQPKKKNPLSAKAAVFSFRVNTPRGPDELF